MWSAWTWLVWTGSTWLVWTGINGCDTRTGLTGFDLDLLDWVDVDGLLELDLQR